MRKKNKKVDKFKGIRTPKTPIARLPENRRAELRKAMLKFIKDSHQSLSQINPDIQSMGLEASLECLEELHEHGYMIFERDQKAKRYGFRIWLYDDKDGVYEDMTDMMLKLKRKGGI